MEYTGSFRGEALSLDNVTVAYSGSGKPAIYGITLTIGFGKYVLITGPNGAGKTTLVETCLGLLKPVRGSVKLLGVDTRSREIIRVRKYCSYVPQNFMRPPYDHYTAYHVISMGLASLDFRVDVDVESVAELLGIKHLLKRPIGTLSGGEQQKVFIARALIRKPKVLLLDEPFASLDRDSRELIAHIVKEYVRREGTTALVVTHDTVPVVGLTDIVVRMENGRVVKVEGS